MTPGAFDYIRNVQVFRSANGQIERYDVEMGGVACAEPMSIQAAVEAAVPQAVQQQIVAPQSYYQPTYSGYGGGGYQDFRCFTGDSVVSKEGKKIQYSPKKIPQSSSWLEYLSK